MSVKVAVAWLMISATTMTAIAQDAAISAKPPKLPKMKDGLRGVMIGSVPVAMQPGQMETVQAFYGLNLNHGPNSSWMYQGAADVHGGRCDLPGTRSMRDVYEEFVHSAKSRRAAVGKDLLVGRYIGAQTLRTPEQLEKVNRWPSHNAVLDNFEPNMLAKPRAGWEGTDFGVIDYSNPRARQRAIEEFIAEARGQRGAPRTELIHFDEVSYLPESWPGLVEVFSSVKETLNREGILISTNLGGYSWRTAPAWGKDVLEQLPRMTNAIQIEGLPDRTAGGLKESELLLTIKNVRSMLDQGLCFEFLPYMRPNRVKPYVIQGVEVTREGFPCPVAMTNGGKGEPKLLLTLSENASATSPLGGSPFELFELGDRNGKGGLPELPGDGWTCFPHPKEFNKMYMFRRDKTLEALADEAKLKNKHFQWNDLVGTQLYDMQSIYRVQAAFALVACRDFEDCMWCHYTPQSFRPDTYAQFTGRAAHDWMRWPELLGPPQELDARILATADDGQVLEMRRLFQNAELIWYPDAGVVRFGPPKPLGR